MPYEGTVELIVDNKRWLQESVTDCLSNKQSTSSRLEHNSIKIHKSHYKDNSAHQLVWFSTTSQHGFTILAKP